MESSIMSKRFTVMTLKKMAKTQGLTVAGTAKKHEIIKAIQQAEGNNPCFGSAKADCDQHACCWRMDCMEGNPLN